MDDYGPGMPDGIDLAMHAGEGSVAGHAKIASNTYAWLFVVGALALVWVMGYFFRSVQS